MIKKASLNLFFVLLTCSAYTQVDTVRVLFLGNSYTGVNNLPQITRSLATGANKTLLVDGNFPGGFTLQGHSTDTTSLNKIMQGNWDFVILQEQSQIPTINTYRYNSMYPGALRLNDTIKKYNSCATVLMYMTWGRRFGGQQCDPSGINCSPTFTNFSHMQDSLESAYTEIADSMNAYISPVGIAWKKVIEDTTVVLHSTDNSHPNYSGSYLAACVFHSIFWDESPIGLTFSGSISSTLAAYLQNVADSTVFHSYSDWNLNIDNVIANYSYTTFGDSVQFSNLSQHVFPVNYYWDFGDGITSIEKNPLHVYASNQTYTVSLIVEYCSIRDTLLQTVNINSTKLEPINFKTFINLFPNPVISELEISMDQENMDLVIKIITTNGKVINSFQATNKRNVKLDLEDLPSGLYFLNVHNKRNDKNVTLKIVKE
jgi:PKD repeat protein